MGSYSNKNNTSDHFVSLITDVLFLPLLIFITIGDLAKHLIKFIFFILSVTYKVIKKILFESLETIRDFFKDKAGQIVNFRLPQISFPKIILPKFPELKLALPKVRLQKIILPKYKLPKFHLPIFSLTKIHWTKTKREKVIYVAPIKTFRQGVRYFIAGVIATLIFVFIPYSAYTWLTALPNPTLLTNRDLQVTTKIFDRNGVLLYEIYNDQNRTPVPLSQMPNYLKEATISIEDRDFYNHNGFSVKAIVRAATEIIFNHELQGGSTITQQLIKSALLTPEVTVSRKIKEILLAFWAERLYSKDKILEMYLNQVPYGGTAWGVEAASQTYYGKFAKDLTLGESALLAGLPAAPTEYSPFGNHPEKAFARQAEVLSSMVENKYITKEKAEEALNEKIHFVAPKVSIIAPHFVMYVKDLLENKYGSKLVDQGGLRIITSLDANIQQRAEEIVKNQITSLRALRVGNGAALVTNPKTGEILAMVGSKDYFDLTSEGNVNVTTSLRQPGSSIKVVNYAAALENGFTAATILDDSPVIYQSPGSPPYVPVNYDGKFRGLVPLRYALGNSFNIPAVKVLAKIGVPAMLAKGKLMGINSWDDDPGRYGLSLTLGGGDVTMLEMAEVYGTLANLGKRVNLMPILEVKDYSGHVLEKNSPADPVNAVKPEVAWILGNILSDNNARITEFGSNSSLVITGKTVSAKTGTSNDKRDNWTIGYTPSYMVATWVGNNDNSPMDQYLASGITGAAPIWHDIMTDLLKNKPDEPEPMPPGIVSVPCYFGKTEYFVTGTEPASGRCAAMPTPTPSPTP